MFLLIDFLDDVSFAVVIELKDDVAPTHSNTKVGVSWL